jgi:glutamate--cysteine ligase
MSASNPAGSSNCRGRPLETIHDTAAELDNHLAEVAQIAGPMGVGFAGIGAAPEWHHDQMPVMPKGRYRLMTDYMGRSALMARR